MPVRACHSNRMRIEGEIGDIKENKIYLGEITNTYYGLFDPIDSAEIEEGKFTFTVDCAKKQMLFLGFRPGQGGMVFAEAGNLKVKPATVKKGGVVWEVSGSVLNNKYRDFLKACAVVRNDRLLDSLDALFLLPATGRTGRKWPGSKRSLCLIMSRHRWPKISW